MNRIALGDFERDSFGPLDESLITLPAIEEAVTHLHSKWRETRTSDALDKYKDASERAGKGFDTLVDQVVEHPEYTGSEKSLQLRTIYEELIELRKEEFQKRFPELDLNTVLTRYSMYAFFGYYINCKPASEGIPNIKARYRSELERGFDYITASTEGIPIGNNSAPARYPQPEKKRSFLNEKVLGAAGLALAGFTTGLFLSNKLKRHSAKGTELKSL